MAPWIPISSFSFKPAVYPLAVPFRLCSICILVFVHVLFAYSLFWLYFVTALFVTWGQLVYWCEVTIMRRQVWPAIASWTNTLMLNWRSWRSATTPLPEFSLLSRFGYQLSGHDEQDHNMPHVTVCQRLSIIPALYRATCLLLAPLKGVPAGGPCRYF